MIDGGAESMSNAAYYSAAYYSTRLRWGLPSAGQTLARGRVTAGDRNFPVPSGMIATAENQRRNYAIPRLEQDAHAVESHRRALDWASSPLRA